MDNKIGNIPITRQTKELLSCKALRNAFMQTNERVTNRQVQRLMMNLKEHYSK